MSEQVADKNRRLAYKLLVAVFLMGGFGVALIPLYDVFSSASGINGKLKIEATQPTYTVDTARELTMDYITSLGKDAQLSFTAVTPRQVIHPGQVTTVDYVVKNLANKPLVVHASASVTPGLAASYVKLLDCFCSAKQQLAANEARQLSMRYVIAPDVPKQYKFIAVSQQFFVTQ